MPSFLETLSVQRDSALESHEGKIVYSNVDSAWAVGAAANGGYALGPTVEACVKHQGSTSHPDPVHVTSHFLNPTAIAPCEVHIETIKKGKTFTNFKAELRQNNRVSISTHVIFGNLEPPQDPNHKMALGPSSPYARRLPLHEHPAQATPAHAPRRVNFGQLVKYAPDNDIQAKNEFDRKDIRTNANTVGGGGLEWGAWYQLENPDDHLTASTMPFFLDIFLNTPILLPPEVAPEEWRTSSWYPTIVMTIEFKERIPKTTSRTVGLYTLGRFLGEPDGRHDNYSECWSSPGLIGEGEVQEGWRERQVCLATATQMALVVPFAVNTRNREKETAKL